MSKSEKMKMSTTLTTIIDSDKVKTLKSIMDKMKTLMCIMDKVKTLMRIMEKKVKVHFYF